MKCDLCGKNIKGEKYEGVEGAALCRNCYEMVGAQGNVEETTDLQSEENILELEEVVSDTEEEFEKRVATPQAESRPLQVRHGNSPLRTLCFNLLLAPILILFSAFTSYAILLLVSMSTSYARRFIFDGVFHHYTGCGDIAEGIIYTYAIAANAFLTSLLGLMFYQILKGQFRRYQHLSAIVTVVSAACGVYVTKYAARHIDVVYAFSFAVATFVVMTIAYGAATLAARPFSLISDRVARAIVTGIAVVVLIAIVLSPPVRTLYDPGYPARMKEQFWTRVFEGKESPSARREWKQEADYVGQRLRAEKPELSLVTVQWLLNRYPADKYPSVALAIVSLPSFPFTEAGQMITLWKNPEINRAIAENDAMPAEVLKLLPDDLDPILLAKAKDKRTSPEILVKLSLLKKPEILKAIVANRNCPPDILLKVANEESVELVKIAVSNPNFRRVRPKKLDGSDDTQTKEERKAKLLYAAKRREEHLKEESKVIPVVQ